MVDLTVPGKINIQVNIIPFGTFQITNSYFFESLSPEKKKGNDSGYRFPTGTVVGGPIACEEPSLLIRD